jgi:hypothetical protein
MVLTSKLQWMCIFFVLDVLVAILLTGESNLPSCNLSTTKNYLTLYKICK